jgi:hypothetical protein
MAELLPPPTPHPPLARAPLAVYTPLEYQFGVIRLLTQICKICLILIKSRNLKSHFFGTNILGAPVWELYPNLEKEPANAPKTVRRHPC